MASLLKLLPMLHFLFMLPYIVYMGGSSDANGRDDSSHLQMLSSLIPSEDGERRLLLNSYNHAFRGFSAMLTENEASILSGYDEVLSVFPDAVLELHTTRSWDFLEARDSKLWSRISYDHSSADVIIGVIDTGIWPESPSFNDDGIAEIPSKWKGVCMEGSDFNKSHCNRKLIGARYYHNKAFVVKQNETNPTKNRGSPRDIVGHGTHTASIAGGARVANASYYGLAKGTIRGGLPSARIASYKACTLDGCQGSIILKAIDDALKDGVDIISISIGISSIFQSDFLSDPIAIGAFHAEQLGIMVVCSGGNDGPDQYTVVNSAPWIFTVAASTIDRAFESRILLGNNESFEGAAINFSPLSAGKRYPLVFGGDVASSFTPVSDARYFFEDLTGHFKSKCRNCMPGSIDYKKAAGKIVVCVSDDPMVSRRVKKLVVEDAKAKGIILIDHDGENAPMDSGTYPFAQIGQSIGSRLLQYINSTKNPTATVLASEEIRKFKPAPVVASFSSRGPGSLTENILKPDIMAPGVAILASVVPKIDSSYAAPGNKTSLFAIKSGTSMACPHVTGAMAFIKSIHPHWTSSIIKSALMTTASIYNNIGTPLTNSTTDYPSNAHETGVGEIFPTKALDPGLAFETTTDDHLNFLCYYGYKNQLVKSMSRKNFSCPKNPNRDSISNINYPTISIGRLDRDGGPRKIKRFATNLGAPNATYFSSINAPSGLQVKVHPRKLVFTQGMKRASFKLFFDGKEASKGYNYGDIRWFDATHIVRLVFAVNVE
ncbi:Xylem serine protein 1 precursor [Dorcoceras hygrometricum]|uniref:Xylem serine protein 1 n=1 Tax=Dorcoceras hygrometricum TaxID=472368 RepID=A0A2Z7CRC4_9LAMI|nr:Xylem serine protein 1 precursor [Dorcoceras hygrometricum]